MIMINGGRKIRYLVKMLCVVFIGIGATLFIVPPLLIGRWVPDFISKTPIQVWSVSEVRVDENFGFIQIPDAFLDGYNSFFLHTSKGKNISCVMIGFNTDRIFFPKINVGKDGNSIEIKSISGHLVCRLGRDCLDVFRWSDSDSNFDLSRSRDLPSDWNINMLHQGENSTSHGSPRLKE
jgi:hypothetical protein